MRGIAARTATAVALLAIAPITAGCSSGGPDATTTAACGNMKHAISTFGGRQPTDPQSIGQAYADVAAKLRAQVAKVKDESVRTAALRVAAVLDTLADDMRAFAAGNFKVPPTTQLTTSVAQLQHACTP